jgi:hypothetical protein
MLSRAPHGAWQAFDDDRLIPAFGFGDAFTGDSAVFPFFPHARPCLGFSEVLPPRHHLLAKASPELADVRAAHS